MYRRFIEFAGSPLPGDSVNLLPPACETSDPRYLLSAKQILLQETSF
jgi:hypothetical protein